MSQARYGLIAMFDSPAEIMHAAEAVRDAGYRFWDVVTPFPIHGMDKALFWWTGAWNFRLVVGGKPFFSPIFAFPVAYELTILFTAFATIIAMFLFNRLPMHYHAVMKQPNFVRATDDKFFLVIEARDPKFSPDATRTLLQQAGGKAIAELED